MCAAERAEATASPSADRLALHQDRLGALSSFRRRLYGSPTVGALFAAAVEEACGELGFERGAVLGIDGERLSAEVTDALSNEASDRLRRKVLSDPPARAALADQLELRDFVLAPVAAEARPLAILLVERDGPPVDALDTVEVEAYADVLAGALAYVVLRARQQELANDLRHFMTSTQALLREVLETPVILPTRAGERPAFPLVGMMAASGEDRLGKLLSETELRIASLLVQGLSNREIAGELIVSPETVKAHVARILRKLGASNRVEAVAMILRLGSDAH